MDAAPSSFQHVDKIFVHTIDLLTNMSDVQAFCRFPHNRGIFEARWPLGYGSRCDTGNRPVPANESIRGCNTNEGFEGNGSRCCESRHVEVDDLMN